jgi:hypothetical protein
MQQVLDYGRPRREFEFPWFTAVIVIFGMMIAFSAWRALATPRIYHSSGFVGGSVILPVGRPQSTAQARAKAP